MVLDLADISTRVGLAFVSGFILGLEREAHGRPAGLRTIVLVCVASCLAAILSEQFYRSSFAGQFNSQTWHPDPARLAAGILTGIGFLGAGVIIHNRHLVRGVTTASQIWFVTILGLCFGGGQHKLGLIGLGVSIFTVYVLRKFELVIAREAYATLTITTTLDGAPTADIISLVQKMDIFIKNSEIEINRDQDRRKMVFMLRFNKTRNTTVPQQVINATSNLPGVVGVHWV